MFSHGKLFEGCLILYVSGNYSKNCLQIMTNGIILISISLNKNLKLSLFSMLAQKNTQESIKYLNCSINITFQQLY